MNDVFLSRQKHLESPHVSGTSIKIIVNFGMETISYRCPQLWKLILDNIKSEPTLGLFKEKIKKWKCINK